MAHLEDVRRSFLCENPKSPLIVRYLAESASAERKLSSSMREVARS